MNEDDMPEVPSLEDLLARLDPNDPIFSLETNCRAAHLNYAWLARVHDQQLSLRIDIPNGRATRQLKVERQDAGRFIDVDLDGVKALGNYDAYYFADSATIEAGIHGLLTSGPVTFVHSLTVVPGIVAHTTLEAQESHESQAWEPIIYVNSKHTWRIPFSSPEDLSWSVEIGSASPRFAALSGTYATTLAHLPTIKLKGVHSTHHDALISFLERATSAIFFELDARYDIPIELSKVGRESFVFRVPDTRPSTTEPPKMPAMEYPSRPLTLFWYARSAARMPLLEFLAYYQVLEYYFPVYAEKELLSRLKQELSDPTFSSRNSDDVMRVVNIVRRTHSGRKPGEEQEQLAAVIRACVDDVRLTEFLCESPEREDHFSKKQRISGIHPISLTSKPSDIREKIAERIYKIRCRIVHTKDDDRLPEMLLPFSPESESLDEDIRLMQFLARRAIVAGAGELHLQ
ncbi:hypothetical protein [Nonomuraea angiospora]|uniref:hypothetical protein n=1 Tax=Nonomuraea angiospora TaxID=46172 RepID=UPI0029B77C9D|nr:hypothetical protein [Nonomuraea angiospora]MDX3107441.1 hypothetical protein [Nonomuraea angiospora]